MGWSRTERKSFFPMSLTPLSSSRDRDKYGRISFMLQAKISTCHKSHRKSTSSRDALSAIAMRFIDEYFSLLAASTIFRHIYFCHERTTMTSEISENTTFVRFYFTLCSLMLTNAERTTSFLGSLFGSKKRWVSSPIRR